MNMSRKIENVRFPSEMSHHRELSPVCGIRLEMIHFLQILSLTSLKC